MGNSIKVRLIYDPQQYKINQKLNINVTESKILDSQISESQEFPNYFSKNSQLIIPSCLKQQQIIDFLNTQAPFRLDQSEFVYEIFELQESFLYFFDKKRILLITNYALYYCSLDLKECFKRIDFYNIKKVYKFVDKMYIYGKNSKVIDEQYLVKDDLDL